MGKLSKMPRPTRATLDEAGSELGDPVPMAPPLGFKKSPSVTEMIRNQIRSEMLRQEAERAGAGSFEEEDDFDVPDDDERVSGDYDVHETDGSVVPDAKPVRAPSGGAPATSTPTPPPAPVVEDSQQKGVPASTEAPSKPSKPGIG